MQDRRRCTTTLLYGWNRRKGTYFYHYPLKIAARKPAGHGAELTIEFEGVDQFFIEAYECFEHGLAP